MNKRINTLGWLFIAAMVIAVIGAAPQKFIPTPNGTGSGITLNGTTVATNLKTILIRDSLGSNRIAFTDTTMAISGTSGVKRISLESNFVKLQDATGSERFEVDDVGNVTTFGPAIFNSTITGNGAGLTNVLPTLLSSKTRLVFEGDSMTAGTVTAGVSYDRFLTNLWSRYSTISGSFNVGATSDTASNMLSTYTAQIHPYAPSGGTNAIMFLWAGFNDLQFYTDSGDVIFGWVSNICVQAKSDGFKTVVVTTTRSTNTCTSAACVARRERLNLLFRQIPIADYLVDANFLLSDINHDLVDGIHPTTNSHALLSAEVDRTLTGVSGYGQKQTLVGIASYIQSIPLTNAVNVALTNINNFFAGVNTFSSSGSGVETAPLIISNPNTANGTAVSLDFLTYNASAVTGKIMNDNIAGTPFNMSFWTWDSSLKQRMIITGNGAVGIGTTTPSSSLDVTGQVRAASAIFTNSISATTNIAAHTTVAPANLHNVALGKGWTNDLGARADLILSVKLVDAVTGDPALAFTNTVTGEAWTNTLVFGAVATVQYTIVVPDLSTNDYGSFTDVSTGSGSALTILKAWWKLK